MENFLATAEPRREKNLSLALCFGFYPGTPGAFFVSGPGLRPLFAALVTISQLPLFSMVTSW